MRLVLFLCVSQVLSLNWCTNPDNTCSVESTASSGPSGECSDADADGYCYSEMCTEVMRHDVTAAGPLSDSGGDRLGETCTADSCGEGLVCVSGLCERRQDAVADGCACTTNDGCFDGDDVCIDGVCEWGDLDLGEACIREDQCRSLACSGGVCVRGPFAAGADCTSKVQCAAVESICYDSICMVGRPTEAGDTCNTRCEEASLVCVEGVCTTFQLKDFGETCDDIVDFCATGLYCASDNTCSYTNYVEPGGACDNDCDCRDGVCSGSECVNVLNNPCSPKIDSCGPFTTCICNAQNFTCQSVGSGQCENRPRHGDTGEGATSASESASSGPANLMCPAESAALTAACGGEGYPLCQSVSGLSVEANSAYAKILCCSYCRMSTAELDEVNDDNQLGRQMYVNCAGAASFEMRPAVCTPSGKILTSERFSGCSSFMATQPPDVPTVVTVTVVYTGVSDSWITSNPGAANQAAVDDVLRDIRSYPGVSAVVTDTTFLGTSVTFTIAVTVPNGGMATSFSAQFSSSVGGPDYDTNFANLPDAARADAAVAPEVNPTASGAVASTGGGSGASGTTVGATSSASRALGGVVAIVVVAVAFVCV